jgi:hypothetical protein
MASKARQLIGELERLKTEFGPARGRLKTERLSRLAALTLPSAGAVLRLHEILCFLRAYPDDASVLRLVERLLREFPHRADLRRFRRQLADTGIAGTEVHYEFFARMAQWLVERWPDRVHVDWPALADPRKLEKVLHLLALYSETPGLDEYGFALRKWIDLLKGPGETDATFLVRRLTTLLPDPRLHEYFYESLALPLWIKPGPDTPARTRAKVRGVRVAYQTGLLTRGRPDIRREMARPPLAVSPVSPRRGRRLIDLAREAMITRSRDLDVFAYGDPRDVRIVDCGAGLQFVAIGAIPERRLMLEAVYGFLTLKNGVPIGYVLNSALFGSVEVAYNVFDTYRAAEAAYIYGRLLATLRHLFRADAFTIYPYQLGGEGNEEGLRSGAWWFYQKLGFRARDPKVLALMNRELRRLRADPKHRSGLPTLRRLAAENVYFHLGPERSDVIGRLPLGGVGLRITAYLSGRFGSDRARAYAVCAEEAARRVGLRSRRGWTAGERLAWRRWSPLLLVLPCLERWPAADRTALIEVVRAKGGRCEADFALAFDRHRRLRRAVSRLAREE